MSPTQVSSSGQYLDGYTVTSEAPRILSSTLRERIEAAEAQCSIAQFCEWVSLVWDVVRWKTAADSMEMPTQENPLQAADRDVAPQHSSRTGNNPTIPFEQPATVNTAENEVSSGTHSLPGRHGAEGPSTYPRSPVLNSTTSQTPYEGLPVAEQDVSVEPNYAPRYRDPTDAFFHALERNSRRLDELERGLPGPQDEASRADARSSQINLIVAIVGLVLMVMAGGTKLYEAIHPPPAR